MILSIETIVHYTVNPGDDSHIKAFGVGFDAASPYVWAMAGVLLIGGYPGRAQDLEPGSGTPGTTPPATAREKGIAA